MKWWLGFGSCSSSLTRAVEGPGEQTGGQFSRRWQSCWPSSDVFIWLLTFLNSKQIWKCSVSLSRTHLLGRWLHTASSRHKSTPYTLPVLREGKLFVIGSFCSRQLIIMIQSLCKDNASLSLLWWELKNFLFSSQHARQLFQIKGNDSLHSTPPSNPIHSKWRLNPFRTSNHSSTELIPSVHSMTETVSHSFFFWTTPLLFVLCPDLLTINVLPPPTLSMCLVVNFNQCVTDEYNLEHVSNSRYAVQI